MFNLKPCAGTISSEFYDDRSPIAALVGPVGSGKTTTVIGRLLQHAMEQMPVEGAREVRFVCVRASYPELWRSTIETWQQIFPPDVIGKWEGEIDRPALRKARSASHRRNRGQGNRPRVASPVPTARDMGAIPWKEGEGQGKWNGDHSRPAA